MRTFIYNNSMNRIEVVRQKMIELGLDGFLVSNFFTILYLSGFKGLSQHEREAWMLITKNSVYFFTDSRYEEDALKQKSILKLLTGEKNLTAHLVDIAKTDQLTKIGFEAEDLHVAEYNRIVKQLTLIPTDNICLSIRAKKDDDEVAAISKACTIADECLAAIIPLIRSGISEAEIAFKIEMYLKERGVDLAFYPIVAIDENAALPHYDTKSNGSKKVLAQCSILIDFGAVYNNYLSDMTRMVFMGTPSEKLTNAYEALLSAQEKTIEYLRETQDPKEIDAFVRAELQKNGHPSFAHSTGHGVGLEIHEYPKISSRATDILESGHIITIEPGIYIPGEFGMRIEDTIFLKNDKTPVVLTHFPKKMLVI